MVNPPRTSAQPSAAGSSTGHTRPDPQTKHYPKPEEDPAAAQPASYVSISGDDFRNLLNSAVREATRQQNPTSKDLRLGEITAFSGKPEELEDFLNAIELIVQIKANIYSMHAKKIVFALTYMTKANAELWKRQYSQAIMAAGAITDTWDKFKTKLRNAFKDAGRQEKAMTWLSSARQKDWDLEKFNTLFEINAGRAGIPTAATLRVGRGNRAFISQIL